MRGGDGRLRELTEEEMKTAVFHDNGGPLPDSHFKKLSPEEENKFRGWARDNFERRHKARSALAPGRSGRVGILQAQADKLMIV